MTTISIRLEDQAKQELEAICEEMGMNLSTLFVIYAKKVLRERKIPFEVAASAKPVPLARDEMDDAAFARMIQRSLDDVQAGRTIPADEAFARLGAG